MKISKIFLVSSILVAVACGKSESKQTEEVPAEVEMSGSLSLAAASLALTAASITDYELYCVTFEETPRARKSDFAADGSFKVKLPSQIQVGCFVNDKATKSPKFTMVFETGAAGKMGGGSADGVALKGNVDLGALTVGSDGRIVVSKDKIEGKKSAVDTLKLADVHNKSYKMECAKGDGDNAQAEFESCIESMMDGDTANAQDIFFRVATATEGGATVYGIGAWEGKSAFDTCGGFDISTADRAKLEADGVVFSDVSSGVFACGNSDKYEGVISEFEFDDRKGYHVFAKAENTGAGFSFKADSKEESGNCKRTHSTSINITGAAAAMFGSFKLYDTRTDCEVAGTQVEVANFMVKFTAK